MALCEVHWFSNVIQKQTAMYVILPDAGQGPFPVYYLLHGLSDDYTIWLRRTRVEVYATGLPLIIVMPDGYRGFYTNNYDGPAYARHIGEELPAMVERVFGARPERSARFIGGLSMGGYGALRIALGYPERFCMAISHSGAVACGHKPAEAFKDRLPAEFYRQVFGEQPAGSEHDLLHLGERAKATGVLPAIYMDCGTEDFLLGDNRWFHSELERRNIAHEYREFPGEHNWDYWDERVRDALERIKSVIVRSGSGKVGPDGAVV